MDQAIGFVDTDFDAPPNQSLGEVSRVHSGAAVPDLLFAAMTDLETGGFAGRMLDRSTEGGDARSCARAALSKVLNTKGAVNLEMIATIFYHQPTGALASIINWVARIPGEAASLPLALSLRHDAAQGVTLDAVLLGKKWTSPSVLLYPRLFRANVTCPYELVRSLQRLMPRKRFQSISTTRRSFIATARLNSIAILSPTCITRATVSWPRKARAEW